MPGRPRPLILAAAALIGLAAGDARAVDPVASFDFLVTGNGFGFQVYSSQDNAVREFLERPYRFLRPNPNNPDGDGIVRRNLAFDTYFGVRTPSGAAWLGKRTAEDVGYVEQTNVIYSMVTVGTVKTTSYFFAPYGYPGNAMVMLLKAENQGGSAATVDAFALANFHMGSAPVPDTPQANGESIVWTAADGAAVETGPGGGALVYLPIGGVDRASCATDAWTRVSNGQDIVDQASCSGDDRVQVFQQGLGSIAAGGTAWFGMAVLFDADGNAGAALGAFGDFLDGAAPEALLERTLQEWRDWRTPVPGGLTPAEAAVWRQSEAVLRMGQVMEPWSDSPKRKNHGMILASLPPGGWHSGWVRDATYAIVALARAGHFEEARAGLDFFLDAEAGKYPSFLNGVDYRISTVRYFGNGEEEADYSGQPTRNIEIDGWGLVLWAARTYVDASGDVAWLDRVTRHGDTTYQALREGVAEALAANLEATGMAIADASIWEVHWGNRQHFLYTTAASARGFCDMAALARRSGDDADRARYAGLSEAAVTAMRSHFVDQNKVLAGSLEKLAQASNYRDGAVVEAFTWDLIPATDPIGSATLSAFSYLKTPAGGYKRVEGSSDPYDTDEWILIDLRASDAWRRAGNAPVADELLGWVTGQASVNNDLVPELYNTRTQAGAIGSYAGSIPMVGYGAGAYLLTVLHRAGYFEPTDCGTVASYPDAGPIDYVDGGASGGDGGPSAEGRTGMACACRGGGAGAGGWATLLLLCCASVLAMGRRKPASEALVELCGIRVEFPGVVALDGVDVDVRAGEVMGLVGENGAGKSTLIKVLAGLQTRYRGQVVVGGLGRRFRSPAEARRIGIAVVHQELCLVPEMSVAENLALGSERAWVDRLAVMAEGRRALEWLGELGEDIDAEAPVGTLGVGHRQLVEIARALAAGARLVVLDEPTAALTDREAERLHRAVRAGRAAGTAFLYVSHRLDEVLALCDRVAVLRDGRRVDVVDAAGTTTDELVGLMTGGQVIGGERTETAAGEVLLRVDQLTVWHPEVPGRRIIDALSFEVRAGEIVGLRGPVGSGRTALLSALYGVLDARCSGRMTVCGRHFVLGRQRPRDVIAAGMALVPEDRKRCGLVLDHDLADNLQLGQRTRWRVDRITDEQLAHREIDRLGIRAAGPHVAAGTLSGGNQQKLVLARCLLSSPRVLLLDEPTRGVDIGARAEIYRLIDRLAASGAAILLASSDDLRWGDRFMDLDHG